MTGTEDIDDDVDTPKANTEKPDAPDIIMMPPVLLLLHIMAGIVLNWFFPMAFGHAWGWLGLLLLGGSLYIIFWAKGLFEKAGTNVPPNLPATSIVTDGPFQYSRNPMYLSFLGIFAGLSLLADAPMMMLLIFPLFYLLDQRVIAPEETYLADKFGDEYLDYKARVRRWV